MAHVEVFTSPFCGYCTSAKALLKRKGVAFEEVDIMADPSRQPEMIQRSGRRTVPQIFIDGQSVGGSDDIHALDREGKLDALLGTETA